jgi:biopolymer transport protein ExbD
MAMSTGGGQGALNNDINVTPMIDVLLVLLIIFMLVVPMARKAIDVQLSVNPDGKFAINKEDVPKARLAARLKEIYDPRPDKIIFVKGANTVKYQDVIFAMDVARGAGVKVIGVPPKDTDAK